MDEPTSALGKEEQPRYSALLKFKIARVGVIFITHRLEGFLKLRIESSFLEMGKE
jgi:ABC-type sugar transport system ATPase subunit